MESLSDLVKNLAPDHAVAVAEFAMMIATAENEGLTGKLTLNANFAQGNLGAMEISQSKTLRFGKKRKVRSAGA